MEPTLNTTTRIITALVVAWRTAAVWQDIVHPVAAGRRPRVISTVEIIKNHHCLTIYKNWITEKSDNFLVLLRYETRFSLVLVGIVL